MFSGAPPPPSFGGGGGRGNSGAQAILSAHALINANSLETRLTPSSSSVHDIQTATTYLSLLQQK